MWHRIWWQLCDVLSGTVAVTSAPSSTSSLHSRLLFDASVCRSILDNPARLMKTPEFQQSLNRMSAIPWIDEAESYAFVETFEHYQARYGDICSTLEHLGALDMHTKVA